MRSTAIPVAASLVILTSYAMGQPILDGSASDVLYGAPLAVQNTQTGFGDSNLGRPDWANGSELDALYGVVYGDTLYLMLAGNLQTNGNKIEIFLDTRTGGQNLLLGVENPDIDYGALQRMGYLDSYGAGLTFSSDFGADFYLTISAYGNPTLLSLAYAELYVDAEHSGVAYYLGEGYPCCETNNGELMGGWTGAPAVRCTLDNSNVAGVSGGFDAGSGAGVVTGIELAIPLSAIGDPTGDFRVTVFINGQNHDYVSNQFLGGFGTFPFFDLGEPRQVNLSGTGHQPVLISRNTTPVGACCTGETCSVVSQASCGGGYRGDNSNCDGNPCDSDPAGRCCIDDSYSGQCLVLTASACLVAGGTYTAGETCEGCPCLLQPLGACCADGSCSVVREAECTNAGGTFAGAFTTCDGRSCVAGACCVGHTCQSGYDFQCSASGGRYLGDSSACAAGTCDPTIAAPYVTGSFQGWNTTANPMTETSPGSGVWQLQAYGGSREEFKITDGTWNNALPNANSWFYTDSYGQVTITYDGNTYEDGWAPAYDRIGLSVDPGAWTAVGGWQGWNNGDSATAMVAQGGGIYRYSGTGSAVGTHFWKAVVTNTWDSISWNGRSMNTADMPFTLTRDNEPFWLYVDALQGRVKVSLDCNGNGMPDDQDIGSGTSHDCQQNGIPDECEADADGDGVPDDCDLCPSTVHGSPVDGYGCPPTIPGDLDRDGDVDDVDCQTFAGCVTGPDVPYDMGGIIPLTCTLAALPSGYLPVDFDEDSDVDQDDFGVFQGCYSGEDHPGDPNCEN